MPENNIKIRVSKRCLERLLNGHLWIFDNDIKSIDGSYSNGDVVSIFDDRGRFIARGYINDNSKIIIRLLTFKDEIIDRDFFKKKIKDALKHRLSLGCTLEGTFRLVFSEGDFLPGLIIDKYEDVLVIQILTLGIEKWKEDIVEVLKEILSPKTIIERSDVSVRQKEGLELRKGFLFGEETGKKIITLDNLKFEVDFLEGHKTGFYLDQQENRKIIEPYVRGKKALDCFPYTGSFAVYAMKYGADNVTCVEDSGKVIDGLKKNISLNGFENKIDVTKADAFNWLREAYKKGDRFDCVMLDPPSFVKTKDARHGAERGYKDINLMGLKLLNDNGCLITSSCSHNISQTRFLEIINDAAKDAGCLLQILENRSQSKDHPILLSMPETHYLKFVAAKKIAR